MIRWAFECLTCGERSDVNATSTVVSPSYVLARCLGCEQMCARTAPGWLRLAFIAHGADWVMDDPLTEHDIDDFSDELERVGLPVAQLEAETT